MFSSTRRAAMALGYAGLIPFAFLAIEPMLLGRADAALAERALLAYGAAILSFLGGIVWGRAVESEQPERVRAGMIAMSVVPSLLAWIALVTGGTTGLLLCLGGFAAMLFYDLTSGLPDWFRRLRIHLSLGAMLSLIVAALV